MSDLIRRQDAIEAFNGAELGTYTDPDKAAQEIIVTVPSAEPKTGEWAECGINADGTHNIKCDQCGAGFRARGHANSHNTKERFKWCPTCGARMYKGGEDE